MRPRSIFVPAVLGLVLVVGCAGLRQANRQANRAVCMSNLSSIGKAIMLYRSENADMFPPGLAILAEKGTIPQKVLSCPEASGQGRTCDYFYVVPTALEAEVGSRLIACDFKGNHTDGRACLFADSHVEFVPTAKFQTLLVKPENASFAKALAVAEGT